MEVNYYTSKKYNFKLSFFIKKEEPKMVKTVIISAIIVIIISTILCTLFQLLVDFNTDTDDLGL